MPEMDLLLEEFLKQGRKQGLNENLLSEIHTFLLEFQFLPAGERDNVRSNLERLIRINLET